VRHFLEVLDELNHLGIEFVSFRENIDTGGPLGRAMIVIVGAIAELERVVERVRAGMRRAKLEGRRIGRKPMDIDREQVVRDRRSGMSLRQVARKHGISRASVQCSLLLVVSGWTRHSFRCRYVAMASADLTRPWFTLMSLTRVRGDVLRRVEKESH
jgi:hypothetical protein